MVKAGGCMENTDNPRGKGIVEGCMGASRTKTVVLIAALLVGCTSETDARRALEAEGFRDIQLTGYNFFACSKDDTFHTGFTATNREGRRVSGTVCSGLLFKNATVRF